MSCKYFFKDFSDFVYAKRKNRIGGEKRKAVTIQFENKMTHRDHIKCVIDINVGERGYLVSGGGEIDRSIKIWRTSDFDLEKNLKNHRGAINFLLHVNKLKTNLLLSSSSDKTVKVWDINDDWSCIKTLLGFLEEVIQLVHFPDESEVVKILTRGLTEIKVWEMNLTTRKFNSKEIEINLNGDLEDVLYIPPHLQHGAQFVTCTKYDEDINSVTVWDCKDYELTQNLEISDQHIRKIICIPPRFTLNNKNYHPPILVTGRWDITIWNPYTGKLIKTWEAHIYTITCLYYIKSSIYTDCLVSGSDDKSLTVWDLEENKVVRILDIYKWPAFHVNSIKLNQSSYRDLLYSQMIVSRITEDNMVKLFNLETSEVLGVVERALVWGKSKVTSIQMPSKYGTSLFLCYDTSIKLFSVPSLKPILNKSKILSSLEIILEEKNLLVVGFDNGNIQIWDPLSLNYQFVFQLDVKDCEISYLHSPTENLLISGDSQGFIRFWDLKKRMCIRKIKDVGGRIIKCEKMGAEGRSIYAVSNRMVNLWDFETGEHIGRISEGHYSQINCTAYIPGVPSKVASGSDDTTIKIWRLDTGKVIQTLEGHSKRVLAIIFIPPKKAHSTGRYSWEGENSGFLASSGGDETIRIWNLESGRTTHILRGHAGEVSCLTFIPSVENSLIANPEDNISMIVSGAEDDTVKLWNAYTGSEIKTLSGHKYAVCSLLYLPPRNFKGKFSPALIASGSSDKTIKIWNPYISQDLRTLTGHTSWVICLAYIPESNLFENRRMIASGGRDNLVKLWDPYSGACINTLTYHGGRVASIQYIECLPLNISSLVSGSHDQKTISLNFATGSYNTSFGYNGSVNCLTLIPHINQTSEPQVPCEPYLICGLGNMYMIIMQGVEWVKVISPGFEANNIQNLHTNSGKTIVLSNPNLTYIYNIHDLSKIVSFDNLKLSLEIEIKNTCCLAGIKTIDEENSIFIYSTDTWKVCKNFKLSNNPQVNAKKITFLKNLKFNDKNMLVSATEDGYLSMRDLETDSIIFSSEKRHKHPIMSMVFFNFGKRELLISGDRDGVINIFNFEGKCLKVFEAEEEEVLGLKVIEIKGNHYLIGFFEQRVKIWSVSSKQTYKVMNRGYTNYLLQELNY